MKQVPDRMKLRREYLKRLRREYLRKKGEAYGRIAWYSIFCVLLWVIVGGWLYNLIPWAHWRHGVDLSTLTLTLLLVIVAVWVTARLRRSEQEARSVRYVPPVTADTLPADEILVRGSEEPPVASSEILLRAAAKGQDTAKEELLRITNDAD